MDTSDLMIFRLVRLPKWLTHVFLAGIRTLNDQLRRSVPMNCKVHFVLHCLEETPGRSGKTVKIEGCAINVRNFCYEK